MKKTTKKTLLYGMIFSASLNLNGCVYGPPQGVQDLYEDSIITASEDEQAETVSDEYVRSGQDTQQ